LVSSRNLPEVRLLSSAGITRRHQYYKPVRHPKRPGLLLTEVQLRATTSHRWGFPCCLSIPLSHMPSPLPRRDWSSVVARDSTSGGLPHRLGRSAPALRVSRSVRRSLTLWPACLLTPYGAVSKSASVQVVTSLNRSRCFRLERPVAGRDSHPLESTRLFTAHHPTRARAPGGSRLGVSRSRRISDGLIDRSVTRKMTRCQPPGSMAKNEAWRQFKRRAAHRVN
jgi:hypothetical protein